MKKLCFCLLIYAYGSLLMATQINIDSEVEKDIQRLKKIAKELSKNIYFQKIDLIAPFIHFKKGIHFYGNTYPKTEFITDYKDFLYDPVPSRVLDVCKKSGGRFLVSAYAMYQIYGDSLVMHVNPNEDSKDSYYIGFSSGKRVKEYKDYECEFFMIAFIFKKIDGQFYWIWLQ